MKKGLGPKHLLKSKKKIDRMDRSIPGKKYIHLCPIGRKTEKKHYHEDVSGRSFYHRETLLFCGVSIYFETERYPDGRRLTYPYNVNISPLGTAVGWKDVSPITDKRAKKVGRLIKNLLLESRLMRKGVSKKRARGSKTKSPGRAK